MTQNDHRIIFTALGFVCVLLSDVPQEQRALRAATLAGLIESFCRTALPDAFAENAAQTSPEGMAQILSGLMQSSKNNKAAYRDTIDDLQSFVEEQGDTFTSEQVADRILRRLQPQSA